MTGFLIRRLLGLGATLLGVSMVIFLVMNILPGDPAAIMLGTSARPDTLAALRSQMGLDQPMLLRYGFWLAGALTGHLGTSYTYGVPVLGPHGRPARGNAAPGGFGDARIAGHGAAARRGGGGTA